MGPVGPAQAVIKEWMPYSRYMQVVSKFVFEATRFCNRLIW